MATVAEGLLADVKNMREQVEALTAPEKPRLLTTLALLKNLLEAVQARETSEQRRAARGVGAAPSFTRLR